MNKRKLEQKKKARELKAHAKVVARREQLRLERKEEQRKLALERSLEPKFEPLVSKDIEKKRKEDIKNQIAKNMKILEALEQEYDKEQSSRQAVHQSLENEGHNTIKDKMDALHQKALEAGYKEEEQNLVV